MEAAEYLRKSRMEEGMETEEVLAKHRQALAEYAAKHDIHIIETYYEVVSGESLYARPEMLRLLEDVEDGKYDAVLVMDLDRLSRGRMKDQGIILDAFRDSDTLIITPEKTYNLSDEIDDELAEFKTFMSRREYKIINKRLRRGLQQSIRSGCYVANAPYGYKRVTIDRKPTLEILEAEAQFVRMIFSMYLQGHGCITIARHINALGARPHRSAEFTRSSIAKILTNPTYAGKIVWDQKKHIRRGSRGNAKNIIIYQPKEKWTVVDGLHPSIIDQETFDTAQAIMAGRYHPSKNDGTIKSALAGLVKCSRCGRNMQKMNQHQRVAYLLCNTRGCCAGAKFDFVEEAVLEQLRIILAGLEMDKPQISQNTAALETAEATLTAVRRELTTASGQKARLYELLEMGEYDIPTFRERMAAVKAKIEGLEAQEAKAKASIEGITDTRPEEQAKKIRAILAAYETSDPPHRNAMLKSIINVIWYSKEKKTKPTDFQLQIDLKPY